MPQNARKLKFGEPPQHGLDMTGIHVRFLSVCSSAFRQNERLFCSEGSFRSLSDSPTNVRVMQRSDVHDPFQVLEERQRKRVPKVGVMAVGAIIPIYMKTEA